MGRKGTSERLSAEKRAMLWELFRPTLLRVTLGIFYVAVCFMFVSEIFSTLRLIPCLIQYYPHAPYTLGLCTINPVGMKLNTIYFGLEFLDFVYQIVYLIFLGLIIPYTLACTTLHYYFNLIRALRDR